MAIEAEHYPELIKFLGFDPEKIESVEAFKTSFQTDFIKKDAVTQDDDLVKRIYGKKLGEVETSLKRTLKELGVEFEDGEVKGVEGLLTTGAEKLKKRLEELKKDTGKNNSEKVLEYEEKLQALNKKLQEEREAKDAAIKTAEETKTTYAQKEKETTKKQEWEKAFGAVKFSADVDEFRKRGFESSLKDRYKFDLNEEGEFVALDKDGNRIKSEDKAYEFLTPAQIVEREAKEHKLIAENPNGGKPAPQKREGNPSGILDVPPEKRNTVATPRRPATVR